MPTLIAHRGHPYKFPENSMVSLRSAQKHSASFVEFDLQLSADGRPFLYHDDELQRCSGRPGRACDMRHDELMALTCGEAGRFGERFSMELIPSLDQVVEFLLENPALQAFVELKQPAQPKHSEDYFVHTVLELLSPVIQRCVIISYHEEILVSAKMHPRIGWVLREWSEASKKMAETLAPDFIFVDQKKLPPGATLWPGSWDWAVFSIDEVDSALEMAQRGFSYIETNRIEELRKAPQLQTWL